MLNDATFVGIARKKGLKWAIFFEVFDVGGIAVGTGGGVQDQVFVIFSHPGIVVNIWVFPVFVDQFVFRLVIAQLVVIHRMVLVIAGKLLAFSGLGITAIKEAIFVPGSTGEFHPFQHIFQLFFGGDVHYTDFLPI